MLRHLKIQHEVVLKTSRILYSESCLKTVTVRQQRQKPYYFYKDPNFPPLVLLSYTIWLKVDKRRSLLEQLFQGFVANPRLTAFI